MSEGIAHHPLPIVTGTYSGHLRPDFRSDTLDAALAALANGATPAGATPFEAGNDRRLLVPLGEGERPLVVERFEESPGLLGFGRSPAGQRVWTTAHRLIALGFDTPRPIGYLAGPARPRPRVSYYLRLHDPRPTLAEFRDRRLPHLALSGAPHATGELAGALGDLVRRLHEARVAYASLPAGSLQLLTDEPPYRFGLLEVGRIHTIGRLSRRTILDHLVQLNLEFLDTTVVTRADRMRFLAAYTRRRAGARQMRHGLWREILGGSEGELARRGESFL